jgi:mannan endo-1,4-beta-mannosidase
MKLLRIYKVLPLLFSFLLVFAVSISLHAQTLKYQAPVNTDASEGAKNLLKLIYEISGEAVLSGQHNYIGNESIHSETALNLSGKYPVIWGSDFGFADSTNDKDAVYHRHSLVEEVIFQYNRGSVITLMWHACRPVDEEPCAWKPSVQNEVSDEEWQQLLTPGTEIHKNWANQVDEIAVYLKQLENAGIPILWRPYHEMNGGWFWWGHKRGENGYKALWKMLYHRLTDYHELNNLVWVWNPNATNYAEDYHLYFPGAEYVDILAADLYRTEYEQPFYQDLVDLAQGKPVGLGEVGPLPSPEVLKNQPYWSWFMTWSNFLDRVNSHEEINATFHEERVLGLNEFVTSPYFEIYRPDK